MARQRTTAVTTPPPDEQPLSTKNYTEMNQGLALLNRAMRKIERAKAAGIQCDQYEGQCAYLEDRFNRLKSVFFPDRA